MSALAEIGSSQWENQTKKIRWEAGGGDGGHSSRWPPAGVPAGGSQPGHSGREWRSAVMRNLARMLFGAIVRRFISKESRRDNAKCTIYLHVRASAISLVSDEESASGRCRPATSPGPAATPIPAPRRAWVIGKTASLEAKGAGRQGLSGIRLSPARTRVCLRPPRFLAGLCPNVLDSCHAANGGDRRSGWRLNGGG